MAREASVKGEGRQDALEMARIRELDSVSPERRTDYIESDFDKVKTHVAYRLVFIPSEAAVVSSIAL